MVWRGSVTYRLVGGGAAGQLRGLPSSHGVLEVVEAVVGPDRDVVGILEDPGTSQSQGVHYTTV